MALYRTGLSDGALRVLAGLPGNEAAFSQLTLDPLVEAEHLDRAGSDSAPGYQTQLGVCAYIDAIDAGSTSRYFYRAGYVDSANNRSGLSLSARRCTCRR